MLNSNFWLYWRTMFAFENWHSALEMKLYLKRYIHHIGGLPDFTALRFTRYNQYESIILPVVTYLKDHGVQFYYDTKVVDVQFSLEPGKKQAAGITVDHKGAVETIDLTEDDLLFITNGGCVESCTVGAQNKATGFDPAIKPGNGWDLWKRIAALDDSFGHPEKFCSQPELTNWESATITTLDEKIPRYIQKICKRDPFSGRTVTGGIVTVKDSKWLMSWTLNRQQQFRAQPKDQLCVWVYGLFSDKPGDYVKKAHARLHRQGDLHGVALPSGRAGGGHRRACRAQRQHRAGHDALYRRLLHAPREGRPPRHRAEGCGELCLHRPVCRDRP